MNKEQAIQKALEEGNQQNLRGDIWFGTRSHSLKAVDARYIHGQWRIELEWKRIGRNGVEISHEGSIWVKNE